MARHRSLGKNPMKAPPSGVTIRMYRLGHGDCFLLCFRRGPRTRKPFYLLIDLGLKGGSQVDERFGIEQVIDDIAAATGGTIDLAVITHEHEDHVSGLPYGDDPDHPFNRKLKVEKLWLAWTENEDDADANALRDAFGDQLLTLAAVASEMDRMGVASAAQKRVADLLSFEIEDANPAQFLRDTASRLGVAPEALAPRGPEPAHLQAFAAASRKKRPRGFSYKMRLAGLRRHVGEENIDFLDPNADRVWALPGVEGVRVYPLGPPRDTALLRSLDPRRNEEFKARGFGAADPGFGIFQAMARRDAETGTASPFAARFALDAARVEAQRDAPDPDDPSPEAYLARTYFGRPDAEADDFVPLRRIDGDWLDEAETLALRVNNEVNNTSLVLLFELPNTGKTLLFTGDAQRGSWISWADLSFAGRSTRELLGACVFYKAGHHGSHNATLKGEASDDWPNLNWLACGPHAGEFTAMIPSNKDWAWDTRGKGIPWKHPLPAIEAALAEKARGRVMVTSDAALAVPDAWNKPQHAAANADHKARTRYTARFIEHWIPDEPVEPPAPPPDRCSCEPGD